MNGCYIELVNGNYKPTNITGVYHLVEMGELWLVGGFNHLEKYESQIGSSSQLLGKIKTMFQTTNQYDLIS